MDTVQITCTLQDIPTFLGVYPSDLLLTTIHKTGTVIINADPHTREASHWLAIHLEPHCPTLPMLIPMAVPLRTQIFFPS